MQIALYYGGRGIRNGVFYFYCVLSQGYGSAILDGTTSSGNPSNISLLRRFNQHSGMVLKACDKHPLATDVFPSNGQLVESNGQQNNTPLPEDKPPPNKKVSHSAE